MADYDYIIVGAGSTQRRPRCTAHPKTRHTGSCCSRPAPGATPIPRCRSGLRPADRQYRRPTGSTHLEPEPGTANRQIPVPRGKLLGGSSWINGLVWVRGQPLDYDTWAQMGCRGWSWHDVAPVFTRMESFVERRRQQQRPRHRRAAQESSTVPDQNPLYDALFAAAKAAGFKLNPDYNSEDQEGVVKTQTSIYKRPPHERRPLLHRARDEALEEPARGHQCPHPAACCSTASAASASSTRRTARSCQARARRDGILSAGGIASPQILELSGIGQPGAC